MVSHHGIPLSETDSHQANPVEHHCLRGPMDHPDLFGGKIGLTSVEHQLI